MTAEEILEEAAKLVEEGWWNGKGEGPAVGQHCAVTGITEAAALHALPAFGPYWDALAMFRFIIGQRDIAAWNDAPGRTQAEVAATLREAAKQTR